jgi:rhodanese-related sulfurtransferase
MSPNKYKAKAKTGFPPWVWIFLAVAVLAAASLGLVYLSRQAAPALPSTVSVAQAAQLRAQGAMVLDVREQSEWDQFHIPDATLIPLGQLATRINEVPKNRDVVVVCRTGVRSAQGRDILLQAGYTRVTSLAGGMTQWQAAGMPLSAVK